LPADDGRLSTNVSRIRDPHGWITVDPQHMTGLICSHKLLAEVEWIREGNVLISLNFTDVEPEAQQ
jgi:hypothetical protein